MKSAGHQNYIGHTLYAASSAPRLTAEYGSENMVSEIVYREDEPWMTQCLLLPLLRQLGQQSRWLLWLTPHQRLSRNWSQRSGLPLAKVMQTNLMHSHTTVESMVRALRTGNYSVVIGWLSYEMSAEEHQALVDAAQVGNALCFIMRPASFTTHEARPSSALKIHSSLYH